MRTKRLQKLLAAFLSAAMLTSLLAVPASAAEGLAPSGTVAVGKYHFGTKGHDGEVSSSTVTHEQTGLTWEGFSANSSGHGPQASSGGSLTVSLPTDKYSTLILTTCQYGTGGNVTVNDDTTSLVGKTPSGSTDNGLEFTIPNATGETKINFSSNVYIHGLTVGEFTDTPVTLTPSLSLDKDSVVIKMGETATVSPTVTNGTISSVTATPTDTGVVTATVDNSYAITLTPAAAGKTTVDVSVDVGSGTLLAGSIAVRVLPAQVGTVNESTQYGFGTKAPGNAADAAAAEDNYYAEGLEWSGLSFGNDHGPQGSGSLTVHIPAGKKTTLTLTTCCYGNADGKIAVTGGTLSDTANDTTEDNNGTKGKVYTITDAAGDVVITFSGSVYVHSLEVGAFTSTTGGDEPEPGPGDTPTEWAFDGSTEEDYNANVAKLTSVSNGSRHSNPTTYGMQLNNGGTIQFPVAGDCTIEVILGYQWNVILTSADGTEIGTHAADADAGNHQSQTFTYTGSNTTITLTANGKTSYIAGIKVKAAEEEEPPVVVDASKIDVWDFGAEQLDEDKYNNKLTADIINGWYSGVAAGTSSKNIASFTTADGELSFADGGNSSTHRLRSTNTALTRWDDKSLTGADSTVYSGYIYSNSKGSSAVYVSVKFNAGDIATAVVGSNGENSLISFDGPSGVEATQEFLASGAKAQVMTFYPQKTGTYKFYSTTEKLVIARIYREHPSKVAVTGSVDVTTASGIPADYKLVFTNDDSGIETETSVTDGSYSVDLYNYQAGTSYTLSLKDANGYVVSSGAKLTLDAGDTTKTHAVTISAVSLVTVTGNVTGLNDKLADAKISFVSSETYVPEFTLDTSTGAYTAKFEKDVAYTVKVEGVNDYALSSGATVTYSADGSADIAFKAKPVYAVTITAIGVDALNTAEYVFTNLNEEGYVYTFTDPAQIKLRDGTYGVNVSVSDPAAAEMAPTGNLVVNGAAVTKELGFISEPEDGVWDFSSADFTDDDITDKNYLGLQLLSGMQRNKTYCLGGSSGEIRIPVKTACAITVEFCYGAAGTLGDVAFSTSSNSTSKMETVSYTTKDADVAAGYVALTTTGTTYFTKITLINADDAQYKPTLTVGADKDYPTINEALDAAAKMDRTAGQRVTIVIDPGNYEEMLRVDTPNITLKNASAAPSLALTNKGVDIDANAVRITSYYGHGYNYGSMDAECKWDADILAVSKANGAPVNANPGSGTTNGSYWNATVIIGADGFQAEGIIFENSFNQYVSAKAANDLIVPNGSQKEGSVPRADLKTAGDTTVQDKKYVERAAALAVKNNVKQVFFDNCKFIGRQDTLYGGTGVTAAFYDCSVYGGTDYIFGGMTAVFAKCDLVFNTSEDKNDVGYVTAPQQSSGRGYLMYNCNVTSTTPGVDTASAQVSKPGTFGRPWAANTGEAVFYETVIGTASDGTSLIQPVGWLNTLSGESAKCVEYNTHELTEGVDNSASRASWSGGVLTEAKLADGSPISVETFLGSWNPFEGKDMTIQTSGDVPGGSDLDAVAGGWFETLFAEIKGVSDADVTAVNWSGTATGSLTGDDLTYLVRDMAGGVRVDVPGLKAGTYDLMLTVKGKVYTFKDITVQAHDRSGFAHYNHTEGVGAYNDDGTLKDNAVVLYVTEENKESVNLTVGSRSVTGIGNILNRSSSSNQDILKKLTTDENAPLVIRFIGDVTAPTGLTERKESTDEAQENGNNGFMAASQNATNVTIEGIGMDAIIDGWGISFGIGNGDKEFGLSKNIEVRNLSFKNVPEDCISLEGRSMDDPLDHVWIHNCSFYVPHIDNPAAVDKAQGDGAVDTKYSLYVTMDYCYFEGYHKTSLLGGSDTQEQYHITWHHNYWKNCESRSPLARQADVHIYNNLYEGQTSYCMSLRANTYIFSEFNTFLNCNRPVIDEGSGGVCKSYGDVFTNCKSTNDATIVTDKSQTVTSANKYANFDTDAALSYIPSGSYKLDSVEQAMTNIGLYTGVMKMPETLVKPDGSTTPVEPTPGTVTGVTLNISALKLPVGGSATLIASVAPVDAANKAVTWTSSAPAVASVDEIGKVTAVAAGTATITVTTADSGKTATCTVTVVAAGGSQEPDATKTYTFDATQLAVGEANAQLASPVADGYITVTGTVQQKNNSDNTKVNSVEVGKKGTGSLDFTVTGTAVVTIEYSSSGASNGSAIGITSGGSLVSDKEGNSYYYTTGSSGDKKTVIYELPAGTYSIVSPVIPLPDGVTEDSTGDPAKRGVRIYTVNIVETTSGGGAGDDTVWVESVTVTPASASIKIGNTTKLTAEVKPDNATDKAVTWSSSDPTVATVAADGTVTAVAIGTASITATTMDGKTAACTVTVTASGSNSGSSGDMIPTTISGTKSTTTVTNPDGSVTTTRVDRAGNTTVTTVAPDGSKVETVTSKAGDKTITVFDDKGETQIAIQLPASIPAPENKFTDVPEGHWAEKSINDMAGLGMVKGVNEEAHIFDMDSPMTRGSIATILFRFSNGAAGKPHNFTDVSSGTWYTDAIGWAAETGVVTGYSETIFAPDDNITREQLAVMLARFAKLIGMDADASASVLDAFVDGSATSSWAVDGMAWCVSKGIVTGKLDSVLDPSAAVSRAEAAVMFDRMIGLIK